MVERSHDGELKVPMVENSRHLPVSQEYEHLEIELWSKLFTNCFLSLYCITTDDYWTVILKLWPHFIWDILIKPGQYQHAVQIYLLVFLITPCFVLILKCENMTRTDQIDHEN